MDVMYEYEPQICGTIVILSVLFAFVVLMWDEK